MASNKEAVISVPGRSESGGANKNSFKNVLEDVIEHCTTVVHVLSIGLTVYILYLCLSPDGSISLTTWHVLLYTVGWTLLMTEGILMVIKENLFSKRLSKPARVRIHWVVLLLATGLIIGGLVTIYEARSRHFRSDHGLSGIVATVFGFAAVVNGIPALYPVQLRRFISPNLNKFLHAFMGFATVVAGAYATITGYYTGWYRNRSTDNMIIISYTITVILTVWSMLKPMWNSFHRIKNMFS